MTAENNLGEGQTDITRFLEKFNQDVASADFSFSRPEPRKNTPSSSVSKQEKYQQSFEKLEEKIRELEDKFEASAVVSEAIMRELARNRASAAESQKSKDAFMANITQTIANLKESVENLSRAQRTARIYDPAPAAGRAFDAAPAAQTSAEEYLAMAHYRPENYRVAQQAKLHAERVEKEKALEELRAEREEKQRALADLQSARDEKNLAQSELRAARTEKEQALFDLDTARGEKARIQSDLRQARAEKERALEELETARAGKAKALLDLQHLRTEKEQTQQELNTLRSGKDQTQAELAAARGEKDRAVSQLQEEREEKARIISSLQQKASQLKAVNVALDREIKRAQQERMDALRKSAEQAKEILSLRDALTAAEERFKTFDFEGRIISIKRHYQHKVTTLENQLQEISNTCMKQVEEIESLKAENLKLHKVAEEREQLAALYEAKTRELEELRASVEQLRGDNDNQARLAAFTHRMQKLQQEHEDLSRQLVQAQEALQSVHAEKKTLEDNFKILLGKIAENDDVIKELKQKIEVLSRENKELRQNKPSAQAASSQASAPKQPVAVRPHQPKPSAPARPGSKAAHASLPEPQTAPVEMQNTKRAPVLTEADLPEIRVADPVPQEETYNGEDFLEKTDSFIGRMKWSLFREDK